MSFYKYLLDNGYYFDKYLIENYLLSLKVKPFIILTGNSGTGKTKLSQLFAQFLLTNQKNGVIIKTNVTVGENKKWTLGKDLISQILSVDTSKKYEVLIDDVSGVGEIKDFRFGLLKGNSDLSKHLKDLSDIDSKQIVPLKVVLSQSNNSEYKIIPVGANWTDNTNIIGYYNAITEEYQSTPAYDLINEANNNSHNPYFLILDEMNLSHVERYFADFLSAIESNEPIPIFGKSNSSLLLPKNLFIIGTVNVDETTYMFSPKVLDRANTIEFNTISVSKYINTNLEDDDFEGDINYLQSPLTDSDISNLNIVDLKEFLSNISTSEGNLLEVLTQELDSFQDALKSTGFDFGFRVVNEILRFMVVAWKYENSPKNWDNWERYFDAQIKQKILPKLHGSQKAIGNVLNVLFNLCLIESDNNEQAKVYEVTQNNCKYYTSALKLQNMSKVLSDQRYVSFIN